MFTLKKIWVFILMVLLFNSCSIDDSTADDLITDILPIESVNVPEAFILGNTYQIEYTYFKPSTCHLFNDLYHLNEGNISTIAVLNFLTKEQEDGSTCENLNNELIVQQFDFTISDASFSMYTFRFWQGINEENGDDIYLIIDVPILQ